MGVHIQTSKSRTVVPNINVTPLVDIVLVLLIIFMVVTPMLTKHMTVDVPAKSENEPPPSSAPPLPPVVLTVKEDGTLRVGDEPIAREHVKETLIRMLNARADKIVFFDAADNTPYGVAVDALDEIKSTEIGHLAVLPEALK